MKTKFMLHVLLSAGLLAVSGPISSAEEPGTAHLETKIQKFYQQMNDGNFETAFQFLATGSSGYMPTGTLIEISSDDVRTYAVEDATAKREAGSVLKLHPRDVAVRMLGKNHALATYYIDAKITESGTTTEASRRVSLVLGKRGDDWKIEHWHASDLDGQDS